MPHMTIWHMRIACWIPKATNTQAVYTTDCVILTALPLQQWLHERASLLRYTYIACIVNFIPVFVHYLRRAYLQRKSLRIYF
jgi:hypothetical protein